MKKLFILCLVAALQMSSAFAIESEEALKQFSAKSLNPFSREVVEIKGVRTSPSEAIVHDRLSVLSRVEESFRASPKEGLEVLQQLVSFLKDERLKYKPDSDAQADIDTWLAASVAIEIGDIDHHRGLLVCIGRIKQQFEARVLNLPAFDWFDYTVSKQGFGNKQFGKPNSVVYDGRLENKKIILPSLNNSSPLEDPSNVAYVIPDLLLNNLNLMKKDGQYNGEMTLSIANNAANIQKAYDGEDSATVKNWKWEDFTIKNVFVFYGYADPDLSFGSFRSEAIKCEVAGETVKCPVMTNDKMRAGYDTLAVTLYIELNALNRGGMAFFHSDWNIDLEKMSKKN